MGLNPTDSSNNNILLLYGFVENSNYSSVQTDRRIRNKQDFIGRTCQYNREHVFAKSNTNPEIGSAGILMCVRYGNRCLL